MKYRSAKGKTVDWTALAAAAIPAEQREIQRTAIPVKQAAQRIIGGHVPKAPESEDDKPAPKAKKAKEPAPEVVEEDPA